MGVLEIIVTAFFAFYLFYVFIYGTYDAYQSDQTGGNVLVKKLRNARKLLTLF
jgi:hypothetical protein